MKKAAALLTVGLLTLGQAWACADDCEVKSGSYFQFEETSASFWRGFGEASETVTVDTIDAGVFRRLEELVVSCKRDQACQGVMLLGVKAIRPTSYGGEQK